MKIKFIILILFFAVSNLDAQTKVVMSEQDFLKIVGNFHPLAKQAKLQIQKGKSTILKARGAFDPALTGDYDNKTYEDKSYFEILSTGLKIPLWFGPDVKFAYNSSSGDYLNPDMTLPRQGLASTGIKMPLGQGLFFDNRRASFRKAEVFDKLSEVEQVRILADLYFDAVYAYWDWSADYMKLNLSEGILSVAKIRYEGIRQLFFQGDIPAIDTLEAYLQILNFEMNVQNAQFEFINAGLHLSNFLWNENLVPLEINENVIPAENNDFTLRNIDEISDLTNNIDSLVSIHPELEVYKFKLKDLEIERRLKTEYLKPKLDFSYDYLNNAGNINTNELFPEMNYKIGIDFSMPLFLRTERADIQLTDIKITETELQFEAKKLEIRNKINSYLNEIELLSSQFRLFTTALENYRRLFEAEQIKFNAGESSLFLLNSRENSLLNAGIKQIELFAKINTSFAGLRWSLGTIGRE